MARRRWFLGALITLGVAGAVWQLWPGDESGKDSPGRAPGESERLETEGSAAGRASPMASGASTALEGRETDASAGGDTTAAGPDPRAARREQMRSGILRLGEALRNERAAEENETEAEEQAREAAWSRQVEELARLVRADPMLADEMVAEMDAVSEDALAVRLARILRRAEHPELLQRMRTRITQGETSRARRTAMLVLESRDHELWMVPVSVAYARDEDPSVRDEAAGVLSRSLADRRHIQVHRQLRSTIQEGLTAEEPATRARALRALLGDRHPGGEDLDRAKALLQDPDPAVRREAARAVRVLESRLD